MLKFYRILSYFNLIISYLIINNFKTFYHYIFDIVNYEKYNISEDKIIKIIFSNNIFIILLIYLIGIEFIKRKKRRELNFILANFLIMYYLAFFVVRYCLIILPEGLSILIK